MARSSTVMFANVPPDTEVRLPHGLPRRPAAWHVPARPGVAAPTVEVDETHVRLRAATDAPCADYVVVVLLWLIEPVEGMSPGEAELHEMLWLHLLGPNDALGGAPRDGLRIERAARAGKLGPDEATFLRRWARDTVLKNVITFSRLGPGETLSHPHGLRVDDAPVQPDVMFIQQYDPRDVVGSADAGHVTVTNTGKATLRDVKVLVESHRSSSHLLDRLGHGG